VDEHAHGQLMRIKWNKACNMFSSFFADLSVIRCEVGDERLSSWCIHNLQLGLSVITKVSSILVDTDAAAAKGEIKRATELERTRKRQEKAEKRQAALAAKEEKRLAREAAQAEKGRKAKEKLEAAKVTIRASRPKRIGRPSDKTDLARARVRPLVEENKAINRKAIAIELGVSDKSVQLAIAVERERASLLKERDVQAPASSLDALTAQAREAARIVAIILDDSVEAKRERFLAYGRALLAIRKVIPSDIAFGPHLAANNLAVKDAQFRSDVMWLAEHWDEVEPQLGGCRNSNPADIRIWLRRSSFREISNATNPAEDASEKQLIKPCSQLAKESGVGQKARKNKKLA
jgi:hypothetical protein